MKDNITTPTLNNAKTIILKNFGEDKYSYNKKKIVEFVCDFFKKDINNIIDHEELLKEFITKNGGVIYKQNYKIRKNSTKQRKRTLKRKFQQARLILMKMTDNVEIKYYHREYVLVLLLNELKKVNSKLTSEDEELKIYETFIRKFGSNNKSSKDFYNSLSWKKLRFEAFVLYGNKCQCCGKSPKDDVVLHVDHIKPRSIYPELELDINNLQILCEECNMGKLNLYEVDYRNT